MCDNQKIDDNRISRVEEADKRKHEKENKLEADLQHGELNCPDTEVLVADFLETEVQDTKIQDTEASSTKVSDTKVSSSEVSGTDVPDTEIRGSEVSGPVITHPEVPHTEAPHTKVSVSKLSSVEVHNTAVVDTDGADSEVQSTRVPSISVLVTEVSNTDMQYTEVTRTKISDTKGLQASDLDTKILDSEIQDTKSLDAVVPDTELVGTQLSTSVSEAKVIDSEISEVKTSSIEGFNATAQCTSAEDVKVMNTKDINSKITSEEDPNMQERIESNSEETNFLWQDYLEVTNSEEVPHGLFQHVEDSLQNELQNGMMLEFPHKDEPSKYWIATVALACGPFSRLHYLGDKDDQSADFWCDLTKSNAHPLGWCEKEGKELVPPSSLSAQIVNPKLFLETALKSAVTVPAQLLSGDGFAPADRIKQGMKVEVQDSVKPYNLWIATVIENVGGRLLLRYDTPDSSSPDFWLYFTSSRIFPMGWAAEKGDPWQLLHPVSLQTTHGQEEWEAILEMAKEDARRQPLPPDIFQRSDEVPSDGFTVGMKVEALHPINRTHVHPATVLEVWDSTYFLVKLDCMNGHCDQSAPLTWLCTAKHPYIFPVGWAAKHDIKISRPFGWTNASGEDFQWDEYLQQTSAVAVPDNCFLPKESAKGLGFQINMKLEAVNPLDQSQICVATISRITGHVLWLHLECNDSLHPDHAVSVGSLSIFPVGWCDSNSYPLKPPLYYQLPISSSSSSSHADITEGKAEPSEHHGTSSLWCPKIYFNHKCFSGPFLSKSKLAGLPQSVGPGPVRLVMREVLAMLISVAYKSSRVLRELQCDGQLRPGEHLEVLKAKYNQTNYRARVAVVSSADQVPEFCQEVCGKLKLCPYLFGPTRVEAGGCPEMCNTQSKTKFTQYWVNRKRKSKLPEALPEKMKLEIVGPKKKRGRKKRFTLGKTTRSSLTNSTSPNGGESDASGDSGRLDTSLGECDTQDTTPRRSEIITRGAKMALNQIQNDTTNSNRQNSERRGVKRPHEEDHTPHANTSSPDNWLYPLPELQSNPLSWSVDDVEHYLNQTSDCKPLSKLLRREEFDGRAFLLLNFPTVKNHLKLKPSAAYKLCRHVAQVKVAFFQKYVNSSKMQ